MIQLKPEVPDIETYIDIRLRAGLSRKTHEAAERGLPNSIFGVTVYDDSTPIGIGRIIGDGGCFFQITDIAVLPAYQKQGIGALIMEALVDYIKKNAPQSAYVSLIADHGTPHFYEKFGFTLKVLPEGAGMYLRI